MLMLRGAAPEFSRQSREGEERKRVSEERSVFKRKEEYEERREKRKRVKREDGRGKEEKEMRGERIRRG